MLVLALVVEVEEKMVSLSIVHRSILQILPKYGNLTFVVQVVSEEPFLMMEVLLSVVIWRSSESLLLVLLWNGSDHSILLMTISLDLALQIIKK